MSNYLSIKAGNGLNCIMYEGPKYFHGVHKILYDILYYNIKVAMFQCESQFTLQGSWDSFEKSCECIDCMQQGHGATTRKLQRPTRPFGPFNRA